MRFKKKYSLSIFLTGLSIFVLGCHGAVVESRQATKVQTFSASKPYGIYALLAGDSVDNPMQGLGGRHFWKYSEVAGVRARSHWATMEPSPGEYNWSHFDEVLALAEAHDKQVGISVAAGIFCPKWIYREGVESFDMAMNNRLGGGRVKTMPVIWDPEFVEYWDRFIAALAARYNGHPRLKFIVIGGPGVSIETFYVGKRGGADLIKKLGGLDEWISASKQIVDSYAKHFTKTPFLLAVGEPVHSREGVAAVKEVVNYSVRKYSEMFGVMHFGLNAKLGSDDAMLQVYQSVPKDTIKGFEMVWSTRGMGADWLNGSLEECLQQGIALGADFIEVYLADIEMRNFEGPIAEASTQLKPE